MRSALYKLAQSARLPTRYIENCKWKNFLFLILSKNEYCYELVLVGFSTFENTFERIGVYAKLAQIFLQRAERKKFFFIIFRIWPFSKKFLIDLKFFKPHLSLTKQKKCGLIYTEMIFHSHTKFEKFLRKFSK